jgi:phosphoribosyl-AMP cyclohydrolase
MIQAPNFEKRGGLVVAIAQDVDTGDILMVAYMNRQAWEKTLETGTACYWSTSRNELWLKGETSGHTQEVKEIRVDCDEDAVLLKVHQRGGAACHLGYRSCFFRAVDGSGWHTVDTPVVDPQKMYGKSV